MDIDAVSVEQDVSSTQETNFGTVIVENEKVWRLENRDFNATAKDETRAVCRNGPRR
jgi:hypothetical protein